MTSRMLGQLGSSVVSLVVVIVGVFLLIRLFGDPTPILLTDGSPQQIEELRHQLGLDRPVLEQLATYLSGVVRGDFGTSFYDNNPVLPKILMHFSISSRLIVGGVLFAILVGIPLGIVAALKQDTLWDRAISVVTILGQSMPTFWTGLILMLVFAVELRWLPSSGVRTPAGWVLPIVTIGIFSMARFTKIMRVSLLEELNADYVRTARSKGLPERVVVTHAVRNALVPVLTLMGFRVAELITGSVVIEMVFGIPGIGQMLVYDGVFRRDFPLVQAAVVFIAALIIAINLIVDWLYSVVDPRIQS